MMYPRLQVARELLAPDGLIFVNVDDNEAASLKLIMAELFGEENFLASIAWEKRYTRGNNAKRFYSLKDTIIAFRKSEALSELREARTEKSRRIYSNPDADPRGDWTSASYVNPATRDQRRNLVYPIRNPFTKQLVEHPTHAWKYERTEHERHVRENRLWWGQRGDAKFPRLKKFLQEMRHGLVPIDLWNYENTGTTDEGGLEVKELFGELVFDNPKPTKLIRRILGLTPNAKKNEIILDFFAGSGTTGHAVYAQNAADNGNRRYILVQLPEPLDAENRKQRVAAQFCKRHEKPPNIAELTKERLRRAAQKVRHENPGFTGDSGFRVFQLAASSIRSWDPDPSDIERSLGDCTERFAPGRCEQEILYELLLNRGLDLGVPIQTKIVSGRTLHCVAGGALIVCLSDHLPIDVLQTVSAEIISWRAEFQPVRNTQVVFKDCGFADDVAKTNVMEMLGRHGIFDVGSL
jgi:adenine-specific DNA-methyltransferase